MVSQAWHQQARRAERATGAGGLDELTTEIIARLGGSERLALLDANGNELFVGEATRVNGELLLRVTETVSNVVGLRTGGVDYAIARLSFLNSDSLTVSFNDALST